jgi:hypothetical protein
VVSLLTVTWACSVDPEAGACVRFSVNPAMADVIEFVEDVSDRPLMLYCASAAA